MTQNQKTLLLSISAALVAIVAAIALYIAQETPPTATVTVTPDAITEGETATLAWQSADADTVTINGEAKALSGSEQVSPLAGEYTYTLVATGQGGEVTAADTLTVAQLPQPPPGPSFANLVKLYSFPLHDDPQYTSGDDKLGFSAGIIGFDEAGTLWCSARAHRKFAPFPISPDGSPSVQAGPWQDFSGGVAYPTADSSIAGLARHNGAWVMTVRPFYNGDANPWILVNGALHQGSVVQRKAAGYLTSYGGKLYSGLAGIPIAQECSQGPPAFEWDIDPANIPNPVPCVEKLFYPAGSPHPEWYQGGVADVDQIRGLCCGANYKLFFGRRPLGEVWYGDGSNHPTLPGVTDPCSPYQGFHSEGSTAGGWLYDANWNYLEFARLDTLLGLPGPCSFIQYAAQYGSRMYVVTQSTELEPRPVVHVLEMQ